MDQQGKKEENKSQDSASAADQREDTAAAEGEDMSKESMDQPKEDGYKADESTGLLEDDDVARSEEASPPPPFAHPWSLLRACAGCLGLLGCCGVQKPPAAATIAATEAAAAAAARSSQEEEAAGETAKANPPPQGFYMQEVITRVWAVALSSPRPPDHAREGSGGHGGEHH